eukprot:g17310.t1
MPTTTNFLLTGLGTLKSEKYPEYGLIGWQQRIKEGDLLHHDNLSPAEKCLKIFGFQFDWSHFPVVKVARVEDRRPDSHEPTRAAQQKIQVGD